MECGSQTKLFIYHGMESNYKEMETSHIHPVLCVVQIALYKINNLNSGIEIDDSTSLGCRLDCTVLYKM